MSHVSSRPIHPSLVRAYRLALYSVIGPQGNFDLHIGKVSKDLQSLLCREGVTTAAYLTAFNPYSTAETTPEQNNAAQADLLEDIGRLGLTFYLGSGRDKDGLWPAEESVLVLGIPLSTAEDLARKYGQNGFVWCGTQDGLSTLKLMGPLLIPHPRDIAVWGESLSPELRVRFRRLKPIEQASLMTVPNSELRHWLLPERWDLNRLWPVARPDGSAMGIGTELDRQFKLIADGQVAVFSEFVNSDIPINLTLSKLTQP